ncbi:MAG: glycosyltransferase family protein [Eubacterium sp.]|nr:glycosyltransferase family protein [Eubacterium sp.]
MAVIQARCGSSRLPNKVLKDIEGKPVLLRMLERVSKSKKVDAIVVATTINQEDLEIVRIVSDYGYRVFVGSSEDVLDRYYQASRLFQPEYVIRLTADCPMLDWRVIDDAIKKMNNVTDDLTMLSETFPDGEDVEIVRFSSLEKAWKEARLASEREHVTLYIKNHPEKFTIQDYQNPLGNMHNERWTLDEKEDLELIRYVYRHFSPRTDFTIGEIYEYLQKTPDVRLLNQMYARNEGLRISLANDKVVK